MLYCCIEVALANAALTNATQPVPMILKFGEL